MSTTVTATHRVAIVARFKGPTDTKGARIQVQRADVPRKFDRAAVTVSWEHGLSTSENYEAAVEAYLAKHAELGNDWSGTWLLGSTNDGYVAVRQP